MSGDRGRNAAGCLPPPFAGEGGPRRGSGEGSDGAERGSARHEGRALPEPGFPSPDPCCAGATLPRRGGRVRAPLSPPAADARPARPAPPAWRG
ncbi:hypothetical protein FVE89_23230 [Methylobacterium sp. 2A]|nr:hypothetical protein [Methylobacterium sp. 2A]